jgi:NitT/TauT family transport system permease protein
MNLLSLSGGLVIWEVVGRWLQFPFWPPFSAVFWAALELIAKGKILNDLAASVSSLALGYGLAAITGITVGLLMSQFRKVEYVLDLYVNIFLASPALIYTPILFALFGVSRGSQIALVFLYSVFVIIVNTQTGFRSVNTTLIDMARSFGAGQRQIFWRVILPGALPFVLTGLRIGFGRAVKGMINGEMIIALVGLGALITTYSTRFDAVGVLAVLLIIVSVAVVGVGLLNVLERRLTLIGRK